MNRWIVLGVVTVGAVGLASCRAIIGAEDSTLMTDAGAAGSSSGGAGASGSSAGGAAGQGGSAGVAGQVAAGGEAGSSGKGGKGGSAGAAQCQGLEQDCGAGCQSVQTDLENCGMCGHSCRQSGSCKDGECPALSVATALKGNVLDVVVEWPGNKIYWLTDSNSIESSTKAGGSGQGTVLAEVQDPLNETYKSLTMDELTLFVLHSVSVYPGVQWDVLQLNKKQGSIPVPIGASVTEPGVLKASNSASVFWTELSPGAVKGWSLNDGTYALGGSFNKPSAFVIDDEYAFAFEGDKLWRMARTVGSTAEKMTNVPPFGIALAESKNAIYCLAGSGLFKINKLANAPGPPELLTDGLTGPKYLATDGDAAYFFNEGDGELYRYGFDGNEGVLAHGVYVQGPIAVDDNFVYWGSETEVKKVSK